LKEKFGVVLLLGVIFNATALSQSVHQIGTGYTPQRVYDSKVKKFSDFETMLADLARSEVVFVGEQHDDPATHRLERAILEGLARRQRPVIVALEMFERDVQKSLNDYLAGKVSEEEFLKTARPWPRYATDYRPLVEMAKAHNWSVVAGNVPRRYASQVSRNGLTALDTLPTEERKFVAAQNQCPMDDYFKRFSEVMTQHPGADDKKPEKQPTKEEQEKERAMVEKFYQAQCVKDETMAESIAMAYNEVTAAAPKPVIVHYNGAFHSDFRLGTAARVKQRLPKANLKVVSVVPLDNLDSINVDEYRKRGDYIVFTLKPIKAAKAEIK
jgi:uncharacterized iron-regulated protein